MMWHAKCELCLWSRTTFTLEAAMSDSYQHEEKTEHDLFTYTNSIP